MSGASEAILEDLLRQANIGNAHLATLIRQGAGRGGSDAGSGSGGTGSFTKSLGIASAAVGVLSAGIGLVTGVFSSLAGAVTGVISNFYNLAQATALSGTKLSEFYATFKDLPIIGRAFGIFSDIIKYQEGLLASYQAIAFAGANFGGNLDKMRNAAGRAYLGMDEFAGIVKNNSDLFALMGGTVNGGINRFLNLQEKLVSPNSQYGRQMAGMGYTAEASAEMLALYIRTQGTMNKDRMSSDQSIIKGTIEYAKQLNELSELTGQNSAELRKKLEEVQMEEAFQNYLSSLSKDKADAVNAALTERMATAGKEATLSLRNAIMGLNVPMNEAQSAFEVVTRGALTSGNTMILDAINSGKSLEEIRRIERTNMLKAGQDYRKFTGDNTALVASMINTPFVQAGGVVMKFARTQENLSKLTEAERIAKARQLALETSRAAALQSAQNAIKRFGEEMMMIAAGIIEPLTPYLRTFAKEFTAITKIIGDVFISIVRDPAFKTSIEGIAGWFKTSFNTLKGSKTMGDLIVNLGLVLIDGFKGLWDRIQPAWTGIVVPTGKALFMDMLDGLMNAIKGYFGLGTIGIYEKAQAALERLTKKAATPEGLTFYERTVELKGAQQDIAANKAEYDAAIKEQKAASDARWAAIKVSTEEAIAKLRSPAAAQQTPSRAMGSLGMTGKLFENWGAGTDVTLHGKEAVVTPEQMGGIVNNSLASGIETLNMQVAELIRTNKEIVDYSRRNVDATRSLSGDLFAT